MMKEENSSRGGFTSSFNLQPSDFSRGEKWFWRGCKPNSVCALASGENHLS